MTKSISNFNKSTTANLFKHQPAPGAPYVKLADLYKQNGPDKVYELCGFYVNTRGQYGPQAVAFTHGCYINLPDHLLQDVQGIMNTPEVVQQINDGGAGFSIYEYESKRGRKGYSVIFCETNTFPADDTPADQLPF